MWQHEALLLLTADPGGAVVPAGSALQKLHTRLLQGVHTATPLGMPLLQHAASAHHKLGKVANFYAPAISAEHHTSTRT